MNIKVIINSVAARKKHRLIESTILKKLKRHNVDIERTKYPGHAVEISGAASNDNFDTIVAVGGDGTINEIVNGMHGSNIALGIIPFGTANDLASYLNIPKKRSPLNGRVQWVKLCCMKEVLDKIKIIPISEILLHEELSRIPSS